MRTPATSATPVQIAIVMKSVPSIEKDMNCAPRPSGCQTKPSPDSRLP